jgi:hypothetical protein
MPIAHRREVSLVEASQKLIAHQTDQLPDIQLTGYEAKRHSGQGILPAALV